MIRPRRARDGPVTGVEGGTKAGEIFGSVGCEMYRSSPQEVVRKRHVYTIQ